MAPSIERRSLVGLAMLVALPGCGPEPTLAPRREPAPTGASCSSDSELTYDNFGRDFFDRYCQSCHASVVVGIERRGAPSDHVYDGVEQIRATVEHIDERAAAGPNASNNDMPRTAPAPTDEERLLLGEWLACGAP